MDMLTICLSVPASFVGGVIYAAVLVALADKWERTARLIVWASLAVLGLVVLELASVALFGPLAVRAAVGRRYFGVRCALFLMTLPSLVNLVALQARARFLRHPLVVGVVCAPVGLFICLMQYRVAETLYGVDGMGGPYGTAEGLFD